MNKDNVLVITDREELYNKCENMEQLFSNYYLPLLEVHYRKTYNLQKEIKELKEEINKISKKELKIMQMLRSMELCPLTKERIDRIEEVMFEILKEDNKEE